MPRRKGPLDNEPFINAQSKTSVNMKQDIGNFKKLEQLLKRWKIEFEERICRRNVIMSVVQSVALGRIRKLKN